MSDIKISVSFQTVAETHQRGGYTYDGVRLEFVTTDQNMSGPLFMSCSICVDHPLFEINQFHTYLNHLVKLHTPAQQTAEYSAVAKKMDVSVWCHDCHVSCPSETIEKRGFSCLLLHSHYAHRVKWVQAIHHMQKKKMKRQIKKHGDIVSCSQCQHAIEPCTSAKDYNVHGYKLSVAGKPPRACSHILLMISSLDPEWSGQGLVHWIVATQKAQPVFVKFHSEFMKRAEILSKRPSLEESARSRLRDFFTRICTRPGGYPSPCYGIEVLPAEIKGQPDKQRMYCLHDPPSSVASSCGISTRCCVGWDGILTALLNLPTKVTKTAGVIAYTGWRNRFQAFKECEHSTNLVKFISARLVALFPKESELNRLSICELMEKYAPKNDGTVLDSFVSELTFSDSGDKIKNKT